MKSSSIYHQMYEYHYTCLLFFDSVSDQFDLSSGKLLKMLSILYFYC